MSAQRFDVIIAGAGLVGACAALALVRNGMRVALVETSAAADNYNASDKTYDLRVSAISPRSQQILQGLGVWQALDAGRVSYYEQMHIWHQHGDASVDFDAVALARDHLGAIVENKHLKTKLHLACRAQAGIEWFMPERIEALLDNSQQGVCVRLNSGVSIEARLLIAADGRNSPTRMLAGIEAQSGNYQQRAIVANVTTELPHRQTAWQRFLATGPLAYLPLANGQSSIVWSCDNAFAQQLEKSSDTEFCDALGAAFEFRLGKIVATGERLGFTLAWHSCERWLDHRVLLIGDAAHSVHPLAGQGLNLGFSDVELLVALIGENGQACNRKQLRRYERQRRSETWAATKSFSGLKWLYGMDNSLIAGIRDCGMRLVDGNPVLKRELLRRGIENIT